MARPRVVRLDQVNVHLLPPQLRELVRVMGDAAAFRLVEHRGGTALSVPKRVSADHLLADLLGPVAFAQLVEARGGEVMQLPKNDSALRQARHQRVHELLLQRHTIREVALRTNYTARQVINIKQSLAADLAVSQGDLFADIVSGSTAVTAPADQALTTAAHDPFGLAGVGRS